ncbi:DUF3892 domain-containing protein [Clostridium lundense]|uniref:DUF3892 domain-containing protein n=1 Tax=Clostridium lundense TaxID=319475 RepID=UPI00068835D6|nr:DUF3892 domain-containing protein [Clostridium lundense]
MYIDQTFAHTIVGVVRDELGAISGYKLEDGEVITREEAMILSKQGAMKGISEEVAQLGEEFLNSLPVSDGYNNLENMPIVKRDDISQSYDENA